jgi:hypothetical protein
VYPIIMTPWLTGPGQKPSKGSTGKIKYEIFILGIKGDLGKIKLQGDNSSNGEFINFLIFALLQHYDINYILKYYIQFGSKKPFPLITYQIKLKIFDINYYKKL